MSSTPPLFDNPTDDSDQGHEAHGSEDDPQLAKVAGWFQERSALEECFGEVLRQSFDEVLDGQRTGRFDVDDLEKTEKTYIGTKVEIVCRAAFGIGKGARGRMDYLIEGIEVDAKFSLTEGWTIPREAIDQLCLVMSANDRKSAFRVGLVRATESMLNIGRNQDKKRTISKSMFGNITWLVSDGHLPENLLLHIPEADRAAILPAEGVPGRLRTYGGQARVNELFRRVQRRLVNRNTVITVASQDDGPKRVRDARDHLRPEGILVLGHQSAHPGICADLGLPVVPKGSYVAVRVTDEPRLGARTTEIGGREYRIAESGDSVRPAPDKY
jgi:hypothetical protein